MLRPPLKWAGGKRWLVSHVKYIWEATGMHSRYVEPLCGGIAIALALMPKKAVLNDINSHAINFYKWLKRGLIVEKTEMKNHARIFYKNRERFNTLISNGSATSQETAELFYYLNRTCYNGLCRFNSKGEFNVPFGRYARINYTTDFTAYKEIFLNWIFTAGDFEKIELRRGDFIYADPPYDVEFTKYSKEDFKWNDQVRLAEWLAGHEGIVVLSNQATERIIDLYKHLGFKLTYLNAPRRISCNGDRTPAREVLATKGI
ncbi:MAG: Dam family site-specific DNA-(adenine-N6)-methyltransferase [candidate division Zixibacteria bacterium]|nr:Dam family site-specific DNA-(adenine-N6)-methyltransferase [candidate division Zixibacteria bacterium]